MNNAEIVIQKGFSDSQRHIVSQLYWEAFSEKLGKILDGEGSALSIISKQLDPTHAIVAYSSDEKVMGVAGFKTNAGALLNISFASLVAVYGWGAIWRSLLLLFLYRPIKKDCLLMDGIFVAKDRRGLGIGTRLLKEIEEEGSRRNKKYIRLDVIDKNVSAKALYEKFGFRVVNTDHTGFMKRFFGFSMAYEMHKDISNHSKL